MDLVHLHFRHCMTLSDTKGHDDGCCHYNSHSSNIARMDRDCTMPQSHSDNPLYPCDMILHERIEPTLDAAIHIVENRVPGQITAARESCQRISQHLVRSEYWGIPNGGCIHGISCSTPWEWLHFYLLGIMKYLLSALFNYVLIPPRPQEMVSTQTWSPSVIR